MSKSESIEDLCNTTGHMLVIYCSDGEKEGVSRRPTENMQSTCRPSSLAFVDSLRHTEQNIDDAANLVPWQLDLTVTKNIKEKRQTASFIWLS